MSAERIRPGDIRLAGTRRDPPLGPVRTIRVTNTSRRPVRVSSHFPLERVNHRLVFDRAAAAGHRLALPAGSTVRFAPGETRDVEIVVVRPDRAASSAADTPVQGGMGTDPARP